jgi:hypothetical protein
MLFNHTKKNQLLFLIAKVVFKNFDKIERLAVNHFISMGKFLIVFL